MYTVIFSPKAVEDLRTLKKSEPQAYTKARLLIEELAQHPKTGLAQVRDIFLFCCYTGLAYADVKKLKRSEIGIGIDGTSWIFTKRKKTETATRVPLLEIALEILNRYKSHPNCDSNSLLPVLSNQKMNSYLKEIADVCGIAKTLTFHIARHTFATTVTLSNGVPIETLSSARTETPIFYQKNQISDFLVPLTLRLVPYFGKNSEFPIRIGNPVDYLSLFDWLGHTSSIRTGLFILFFRVA